MTHPNATDAALYWGLIGVGVGAQPTDRDATATGARATLRYVIDFAIRDPGLTLNRYQRSGESLLAFQTEAVMVQIDLLASSKARSFTPHQAPAVDVMNLAAEYVQFVPASLVTVDLQGAQQTRREYYEPSLMRAAFRHGWDAHAADPAPAQIYCCSGCGWIALDPAADLVQLRSDGAISCCPERDMQPMDPRAIMGKLMDLRRLRKEAAAAAVRTTTDALSASVPTRDEMNAALKRVGLSQLQPEPACRVCGCTESTACVDDRGPCWWVEKDLCSHCKDPKRDPVGEAIKLDQLAPTSKNMDRMTTEALGAALAAAATSQSKPTADAILAVPKLKPLQWKGDEGSRGSFVYTIAPPNMTKGWRVWCKLRQNGSVSSNLIVTMKAGDRKHAIHMAEAHYQNMIGNVLGY